VQNSQERAWYIWKKGVRSDYASLSFPNIYPCACNLPCWQRACD